MNKGHLWAPATTESRESIRSKEFKAGGKAGDDTEKIHWYKAVKEPRVEVLSAGEARMENDGDQTE